MPAKRPQRPAPRTQISTGAITDLDGAERAISALADQVSQQTSLPRVAVVADLEIGSNRVIHLLGRKPIGITLTPTVADATFAWALIAKDERTITISVLGAAQPKATIEVF